MFYCLYILQKSVILIDGVGGEVFWKCMKMDIHVLYCGGIFLRVGVWTSQSKWRKSLKSKVRAPEL